MMEDPCNTVKAICSVRVLSQEFVVIARDLDLLER